MATLELEAALTVVRSFYRRENAAARAYEERCEHIQALLENYLDRPLYPGELVPASE